MKIDNYYDPVTCKPVTEIRIERNDIEHAASWYHRIPLSMRTETDRKVYDDVCKAVAHMRSLGIK